jgi:hypothetical protein
MPGFSLISVRGRNLYNKFEDAGRPAHLMVPLIDW